MLFEYIDFTNRRKTDKLISSNIKGNKTWNDYYNTYNYSLKYILEKGVTKRYDLNCKSRPILFLIRHNFELCLKRNLVDKNINPPLSHKFEDIINSFDSNNIPSEFIQMLKIIDRDNLKDDGSCYRYISDINNRFYFPDHFNLNILEIIKLSWNINKNNPSFMHLFFSEQEITRRKENDFIFTLGDSNIIGQLRTEYDQCIEMLIKGIIEDDKDVNLFAIPLFFLIRHSLELALKENIIDAQNKCNIIDKKDFSDEHSLARLFNCYHDFLRKIDYNKLSDPLSTEISNKIDKFSQLKEKIHQLDTDSKYFRFPVDNRNQTHVLDINNKDLKKTLKLYYEIDSFITFNNTVLEDHNILEPNLDM